MKRSRNRTSDEGLDVFGALESPGVEVAETRSRVRRTVWFLAAAYAVVVAASAAFALSSARTRGEELARSVARSYFQSVVAMRAWSAWHGGVYLFTSDKVQPNPFLESPRRDLATVDGRHLTLVNPAYMTRLVSDFTRQHAGIQVHITSLRPIRPANAADAWETRALGSFRSRESEAKTLVADSGGQESFRYMAPLVVEESCLGCHGKQGYRVGDIRGGISISFPYAPFAGNVRADQGQALRAHALSLLFGLCVLWFTGRHLLRGVDALHDSLVRVRSLEGLLPICSHCKRIRRDGGNPHDAADWEEVETYLGERTEASFTHGICPDCMKKHYP